ncbi:MAG: tRNA preQ1(34) S-adenosylmethionine ribosyltransferase-isomerase QueA [Verrucomicrobiae bacterium]|nr:tRNA preQ1(34) S-adenosylmethionine ribosyltransferase-isomerase QueA [Verrucomicrobiae bacterium]
MRLDELDFHLPPDLIACQPVEPRDACRLLVLNRSTRQIEHRHFSDLPSCLKPGDLLVMNNAKVTPARIFVHRPENPREMIELLLLDASDSVLCHALASPSRKLKPGGALLSRQTQARIRILPRDNNEAWTLELEGASNGWRRLTETEGHMPLPPYILKKRGTRESLVEDRAWYQTTFAERDGAIAAPTAGLHFTPALLDRLRTSGIATTQVFLKVSAATFLPVRTATLEEHPMGLETYDIPSAASQAIETAKSEKRRIIAVGTTVVRTLESAIAGKPRLQPGENETRLLISPPHSFRLVDALTTNFHLPRSTLLALVYAFADKELIRHAYDEAVKQHYRFYSYGDAMLIL